MRLVVDSFLSASMLSDVKRLRPLINQAKPNQMTNSLRTRQLITLLSNPYVERSQLGGLHPNAD